MKIAISASAAAQVVAWREDHEKAMQAAAVAAAHALPFSCSQSSAGICTRTCPQKIQASQMRSLKAFARCHWEGRAHEHTAASEKGHWSWLQQACTENIAWAHALEDIGPEMPVDFLFLLSPFLLVAPASPPDLHLEKILQAADAYLCTCKGMACTARVAVQAQSSNHPADIAKCIMTTCAPSHASKQAEVLLKLSGLALIARLSLVMPNCR